MKKLMKWAPALIALIALVYSVVLGAMGHTEEAQYSSHWSGTLILFYLLFDKINE